MPCAACGGHKGSFCQHSSEIAASVYELLTRQMVGDLAEELREIRLRVNGLVFVTVGAVVADIVLRLVR